MPTYDARGNLTSAGGTTYGYDAENKLTHLNGQAWLTWEPGGRLAAVANDAFFGYDGMNLIAESDGVVPITRRYVHGPGIDEPLVWYEGGGLTDRRFLHADERGSIVAVTDNAGIAIGVNSYDEYGIPGENNLGRFQYTGQTWLPGLGLYHYKARFYSPTLGRFLQTDPIGYGDGMNMYAYVGNDPVNWVDPTGLLTCRDYYGPSNSYLEGFPPEEVRKSTCEQSPSGPAGPSGPGEGPSTGTGGWQEIEQERQERIERERQRRERNRHCASLRRDAARESLITGAVIGGGAAVVAATRFGERFGPKGFALSVLGAVIYSFATATDGDSQCQ